MTALTFTLFEALEEAGVSKEKAKAATEAVERSIAQAVEERYTIHSKEVATRGDVEKVRLEIEKVRLEIAQIKGEMATKEWVLTAFITQTIAIIAAVMGITAMLR